MAKLPTAIADMQLIATKTLTRPLSAPVLTSTTTGTTTATLNWTAPTPTGVSVIAGYRLKRASVIAGPYTTIYTGLNLSFNDTVAQGTVFYTIEAFDQFVTGTVSSPLSVAYIGGAAQLLINETWATPTSLGTFPASTTYSSRWTGVGDTGQTRNVQNSPVSFNSGNVAYFVLNPAGCTGVNSSCQPTGAIHSTVTYAGPQANFTAGVPYWIGFACYLTGGWAPNGTENGITGGYDFIFQLHPSDQLKDGTTVFSGIYANPMLNLSVTDGPGAPFSVNVIGRTTTTWDGGCNSALVNHQPIPAYCTSPGSLNRNITYPFGTMLLNVWQGHALNIQISTLPDGSDGFVKWYHSPGINQPWQLMFTDVGANDYYSDARRPYPNFGLYHGEGSRSIPPGPQAARQISYGPYRFGRADSPGNCTLADVIPWGGNH